MANYLKINKHSFHRVHDGVATIQLFHVEAMEKWNEGQACIYLLEIISSAQSHFHRVDLEAASPLCVCIVAVALCIVAVGTVRLFAPEAGRWGADYITLLHPKSPSAPSPQNLRAGLSSRAPLEVGRLIWDFPLQAPQLASHFLSDIDNIS